MTILDRIMDAISRVLATSGIARWNGMKQEKRSARIKQ